MVRSRGYETRHRAENQHRRRGDPSIPQHTHRWFCSHAPGDAENPESQLERSFEARRPAPEQGTKLANLPNRSLAGRARAKMILQCAFDTGIELPVDKRI